MSTDVVREGDLLWTPSPEQIEATNLTALMRWLAAERGLHFDGYPALWRWSVEHIDDFWQAVWDYFEVESSAPHTAVLGKRSMPGAQWFPGARLNYAQHVLRRERQGTDALLYLSEERRLTGLSWESFAGQVRILATQLRKLGIRPGDCVASYMPNIPQTVVAMLAVTSIGAVWASVSPDFGSRGAIERISQLNPKALFCVDGYRYGGKPFSRPAG